MSKLPWTKLWVRGESPATNNLAYMRVIHNAVDKLFPASFRVNGGTPQQEMDGSWVVHVNVATYTREVKQYLKMMCLSIEREQEKEWGDPYDFE